MINLENMEKQELIELIHTLGFDSKFGMYQRDYAVRAIGGRHGQAAFLDIDDFKALNTRYGYQEADRRVKEAFAPLVDKYTVFRWFSGDEIVVFGDVIDPADLQTVAQVLPLTARIGNVGNEGIVEAVNALSVHVMRAKKTGRKNTVAFV